MPITYNSNTKECSCCHRVLPLSDFHKDRTKADGLYSSCKECKHNKAVWKNRSKETLLKQQEYRKKRWANDPEFRKRSRDGVKEYLKNHPEKAELYYRTEEARERQRQASKRYRDKGGLKNYVAKRRKEDPSFGIMLSLRARVKNSLKGKDKSSSTVGLVGCSMIELKKYLESQFKEGMSWENYGIEWHIDHIVPCSFFDLSNEDHQRICFNWRNLQPLWKKDNLSKNRKLPSDYKERIEYISKCLDIQFDM